MQSRSFLRLLASLALAALLVSCGDDGSAGGGNADEPTAKKDAGIKRRDASTKPAPKDEDEDEGDSDDDSEDEEEVETPVADAGAKGTTKADAGKVSCTVDTDCVADDEMSGIGCCDKPTKVCFFTEATACPAPKPPGRTGGGYM